MIHDPLKCGECGCDTFKLENHATKGASRVGGGDSDVGWSRVEGTIVAICTKCGAKSEIGVMPSNLAVHVNGTLCGGWK